MLVFREWVDAGGLISYGVSGLVRARRRVCGQTSQGGHTPSDLPIEQPTKFELILNRKTAKEIGLTIPEAHCCAPMR